MLSWWWAQKDTYNIWAALQAAKCWVSKMLTSWQLRVKEIKPEVYNPEHFIQVMNSIYIVDICTQVLFWTANK